jgi:tRNA modification GTPase
MSDTAVSLLTAPGTGAIATVEVRGPRAWELARTLFAPAGKLLPESPDVSRFWFGTLAGDEVVLAVTAPDAVEVHCHGGPRVVQMVIAAFEASGGRKPPVRIHGKENRGLTPPARLLQFAPTLRTAGIILDQLHGAFANEVRRILALLESDTPAARAALVRLSELGNTVGRHLVEPWKVVIAGPPNVGKSSLVNALAGYQRAVVSEVAGTTRDAVGVRTAFDGWPVELIDTAGLRAAEGLEAEGIERTRAQLATADRAVWVIDATAPPAALPVGDFLLVANKCDLPAAREHAGTLRVSAFTGAGVPELARALVAHVPHLAPGEGVPYSAELIELVNRASAENDNAARHLRAALEEERPG